MPDFDPGALIGDDDYARDRLKANPILWGTVGITQTLLTSGVIFGWASLLPVIRASGVEYTPEQFSLIFTAGAVGNYTSTLIFGMILDNFGPKITSIIASVLFGFGLNLCSVVQNYYSFALGFSIIGFAGPGIQMPTLHLANLFPSKTGGAGALYMSAQAAAFDGGTAVFAIVRLMYQLTGLSASSFFLMYNLVPAWCLLTAVVAWPNEILDSPSDTGRLRENGEKEEYIGVGSPYLSPKGRLGIRNGGNNSQSLINAPVSVILKHSTFWSMAGWAGIHILKLNFVVATINDQLDKNVAPEVANHLIDILGAMLPFGFVALPFVAALLDREPIWAFELANIIGIFYGSILAFFPTSAWMQCFIVFPSIACSRQLVYSTLFHQVGTSFGFVNYGVLLGLINVMVSLFSTVQTPLVETSENHGSYYLANLVLWAATFPLVFTVLLSTKQEEIPFKTTKVGSINIKSENSRLLADDRLSMDRKRYRSTGNFEL
eukprot:jgi/Psemu1/296180/fgenesh1_pm.130_\